LTTPESLRIKRSRLEKVSIIQPATIFHDERGTYIETYNEKLYRDGGVKIEFIQDDISISKKNVLRGIHGDQETWKLVTCLSGAFYLIVVNNDPSSGEYKKWQSFILTSENNVQILIPPKFGNGHVVLSEDAIFHYKQSTYYNREGQFTIKWNDPEFNFEWPISNPITSARDSGL
tara:strand:- start:59 stop:583 length:525 start_codon:yes stop_codon:yes gene_type:complete